MQLSELNNKKIQEWREKNHLKRFFSLDAPGSFRIDIEIYDMASIRISPSPSISNPFSNHTSPLGNFRIEPVTSSRGMANAAQVLYNDEVTTTTRATVANSGYTTSSYAIRNTVTDRFEQLEDEIRNLRELVNELRGRLDSQ